MNLSYSYFTMDTMLPWTPGASVIRASFKITLYKIEKTCSLSSRTRLSRRQNN